MSPRRYIIFLYLLTCLYSLCYQYDKPNGNQRDNEVILNICLSLLPQKLCLMYDVSPQGSCQLFLPLTDQEMEQNYNSGHVCGDDLGMFFF
jgi:hypothetical protein